MSLSAYVRAGLAKIRAWCYSSFLPMLARFLRHSSFVIACIAVSACAAPPVGSANGAGATSQAPSLRSLTNGSQTVVVSDASQNDVVICGPGSPCNSCKTIGSGLSMPMGVTTNGGGPVPGTSTLDYVADSGNQRVVVFTDTCTTVAVLNDTGYFPSDVAVAHDGTVAVTNVCTAPSCAGSGNISFYAPGSSSVTRVAKGLMSQYYYGDFDKRGDFYNDGLSGSTVEVGVVRHNSKSDKALGISGITSPGGIQIARNGTINILDEACPCVQIYSGSKHVGTVSLTGVTRPVTFALDQKNKHLWVTDVSSKTVDEFAYPSGGSILYQYGGFYEPIGVGVVPPDKP
jgi:hypothetical protein